MFCPTCHTQNRDNAKFCKGCGLSFPAEQGGTEQPQAAPMQAPVPTDQAETSVATAPASTHANVGEEDISMAPTIVLTPQEMMAYHARRWQHELEQEQARSHQAAATAEQQNATDIADLPTMRMMPVVVPPASTTPTNVETPAVAPTDAEAQPVASTEASPAIANDHVVA